MMNTAIVIFCYAKSIQVNLFQEHIEYFLYANKTSKRIIESLYQLGLFVTYKSIIVVTKAMTQNSAKQLETE
jgi:hypothetical protein